MVHNEIVIDYHYSGLNPIEFGYETCAPSQFFGPAVRTFWLLHYVVSGFGHYKQKEKTYHLKPGQIFVIPPYVETYYEADAKNPWHYIWIGFTMDEDFLRDLLPPVISECDAGFVFDDMIACKNLKNGRSAYLSGCIWKLMSILLEHEKPKEGYIEKALNCMHTEYAHGIGVQEIADRIGLCRGYFSSIFSKQMGVSPCEYLIQLRLKKAAELMSIYQIPPTIAARSVGYEDLYHFSKMFKKHYGESPRAYQKHTSRRGCE